jgi:Putative restriction endonuclease
MSTTTAVALDPDKLYEIVDGQPAEKEMPGARHSGICTRHTVKLGMYLTAHQLGGLYAESSFQIGANERIPDLAFVSTERIPSEGEPDTKWPMPPELAVEVISPNDLYEKVYAIKFYCLCFIPQLPVLQSFPLAAGQVCDRAIDVEDLEGSEGAGGYLRALRRVPALAQPGQQLSH